MKPTTHFCSCEDFDCKFHPTNHQEGCDPCIQKNLRAGEIPSCFFKSLHPDLSQLNDFKTKDFVEFYKKHQNKTSK